MYYIVLYCILVLCDVYVFSVHTKGPQWTYGAVELCWWPCWLVNYPGIVHPLNVKNTKCGCRSSFNIVSLGNDWVLVLSVSH